MASHVTLTVGIYCFACWSKLEAILFRWSFHLLLNPGYSVSPASHKKRSVSAGDRPDITLLPGWLGVKHQFTYFSRCVVPAILFFPGTRGTFTGKNRHSQSSGAFGYRQSLSCDWSFFSLKTLTTYTHVKDHVHCRLCIVRVRWITETPR